MNFVRWLKPLQSQPPLLYHESTGPLSPGGCRTREEGEKGWGLAHDVPSLRLPGDRSFIHLLVCRSNHTSELDFVFLLKVITAG